MGETKPIFTGRDTARGEAGAATGSLSMEIPFPDFVLWGQRVEHYARAVGYQPENHVECTIRAICWPGDAIDNTLLNQLKQAEVIGDSFSFPPEGLDVGIGIDGTIHPLRLVRNEHGRLSGFELGPFAAPSVKHALARGELIASSLQRSAALSGVPLRFANVRAATTDLKEMRETSLLPYPIMPLVPPSFSPFPVCEAFLATLAEGRRNTSIFYRALVFFKITEAFIDKVQPALSKAFLSAGLTYDRLELLLPDAPFSRVDSSLVGKAYTAYRSGVQPRIRDVIAHLDPKSEIVPFDLSAEAEVRTASIVLHYIATKITIHVQESLEKLANKDMELAVTFTYDRIDKRRRRKAGRLQHT